jgi:hypothetical protein
VIDWFGVFANSLWVGALALVLALISRASWQSGREQVKFSAVISRNPYQSALFLAGVLFCSGMALTSTSTLKIVIWAGLALACLISCLVNYPYASKLIRKR